MLEPIWKVLEKVMDLRLEAIVLHNSLHGCLASRGTGTGMIEAKLVQQLAHLEQAPFFGVFIDLPKAFDAMDWGQCLKILVSHRAGPQILRLIRNFWDTATNVCWQRVTTAGLSKPVTVSPRVYPCWQSCLTLLSRQWSVSGCG